jgi:NAD(P)-dependent dehydrogenase (short-subunit alcohol dehydrogenase family)
MSLVVITGGNRGIGWELAKLYSAEGRSVVLGVRTAPSEQLPENVSTLELDAGDGASVQRFAAKLNGAPVGLLINNAGILGPARQSTTDMDFDGFAETLNINTLGPLRVTQALLPNLKLHANSKVAIMTSRMGSLSYAKSDTLAYRASKAAANKVSQALATDLKKDGIAVAALHPGWARTDMGGPGADISPEHGAAGVKAVIDRLSIDLTGRFWNYDGAELAW